MAIGGGRCNELPREPQHAAAFINFIGGYLRVVSSCSVGSFTNIECSADAWRVVPVVNASYLATNSATLTEFFAGANQGLGLKLIRFGRIYFVILFPGDCPNSLVAGGAMVVGTGRWGGGRRRPRRASGRGCLRSRT